MSARVTALLLISMLGTLALAGHADPVCFPAGYRQWILTRFRHVGPPRPNYEKAGGLRHYFANRRALESWGHFRDGSVIVDERVHAQLNDQGIWEEAGPAHVAVMRKDAKYHPDTSRRRLATTFSAIRVAER